MKSFRIRIALISAALTLYVATAASAQYTFTVLHVFDGTDGSRPRPPALLAQGRDGNLYGTMDTGGKNDVGVVFQLTLDGTVLVLHNFSGPDGMNPCAGLTLAADGKFYGTTQNGGANGFGTIFTS